MNPSSLRTPSDVKLFFVSYFIHSVECDIWKASMASNSIPKYPTVFDESCKHNSHGFDEIPGRVFLGNVDL